jgi:alpha-tubulin suppressor-like RCC1 family protein
MGQIDGKWFEGGYFTTDDKELYPSSTISGDVKDTGITILETPRGHISVLTDGVQQRVGDGTSDQADCFFSSSIIEERSTLSAGYLGSRIIQEDGTAWACGYQSAFTTHGFLGINTTSPAYSPTQVVLSNIIGSAFGYYHSLLLTNDGRAWGCGANNFGELGTGNLTNTSSPASVIGNHSFVEVGGIFKGSIARKEDGTVWTWGENSIGALGDNSVTNRSSPVSVKGDHSFIQITSALGGQAHGLKADGTVWGWGDNGASGFGAVGDNTINNRSSPVSVKGDHSFIMVDGGIGTIALKEDGTAWCWGTGSSGQNGQSTVAVNRSSPVSVTGNHSFVKVYAEGSVRAGLKNDGSLWTWGANANGELGLNSAGNRSSPSLVVGNHSFIDVAIGKTTVLARKREDDSVWAWGSDSGALGQGSDTGSKSSPVLVLGGRYPPVQGVKSAEDVVAGDRLHWRAGIAGFDLDESIRIDLLYRK